jgi:hypothetical protein
MGLFLCAATIIDNQKNAMIKSTVTKKSYEIVEPSTDTRPPSANTDVPAIALAKFWLLEECTTKKLGLRSSGSLSYQVLADQDRKHLFIALTKNDGSGYYSKERVNMITIEACLYAHRTGKPFPSKGLKDAYKSKSSS